MQQSAGGINGAFAEHAVQLFDSLESRAEEVSTFVGAALATGVAALVVAKASHWAAIEARLQATLPPMSQFIERGQLVFRDADEVLSTLMRCGRLDSTLFDQQVGELVKTLSDNGRRPLFIYGEMVDLLAVRGEYLAALRLESLWNDLATRMAFKLLCGYASACFGDPRRADTLDAICQVHSHARSHARDVLGSFLLDRTLG